MMDMILSTARGDERIRAVYMNGSRANPNVVPDALRDYDIVYVVWNVRSFLSTPFWIDVFGPRIMLQEPERENPEKVYVYLMLFEDGNRIDLMLETVEEVKKDYGQDSLTIPLLDKDGILPSISESSDRSYWVRWPTQEEYDACANDFWWCMQNVAKGIVRDELPYARSMFETVIRERLDQMVNWSIGVQHDFQVNPGKMGKWYAKYLPQAHWKAYQKTYAGRAYDDVWDAIFEAGALFRALGSDVADALSFHYPIEDDVKMSDYLRGMRSGTPQDGDR